MFELYSEIIQIVKDACSDLWTCDNYYLIWDHLGTPWIFNDIINNIIDNGWIILIWVTLLSLINSRSVSPSERPSWTRTKILLESKIFRKKNFCSSPSSPHLSNVSQIIHQRGKRGVPRVLVAIHHREPRFVSFIAKLLRSRSRFTVSFRRVHRR